MANRIENLKICNLFFFNPPNDFVISVSNDKSTKKICNALQVSSTNSWVMLYRERMFLRHCLELFWFNKTKEENR